MNGILLETLVVVNKKGDMEAMIGILLRKSSEYGERLDCAIYLGEYDNYLAEQALFEVAMDVAEDEDLVENCVESLARIWLQRGRINDFIFNALPEIYQARVLVIFRAPGAETP